MAAKKKTGRIPKKPNEKVISKGVYLTGDEWKRVIRKFGTPTKAMRDGALSQCA